MKLNVTIPEREFTNLDARDFIAKEVLNQNLKEMYLHNCYYDERFRMQVAIEKILFDANLSLDPNSDNKAYFQACVEACFAHASEIEAIIQQHIAFIDEKTAEEVKEAEEKEAFKQRWTIYRSQISGRYFSEAKTVDDLKANTWCEYGNRLIFVIEDADYDYNYYSKSYGHPKKTVNGRYVIIKKLQTRGRLKGCIVSEKKYEIESFRQGNILAAIAEHFGIEKPAKNKLQTTAFYEIKKVNKNLYKQVFGKQIIGYVAVDEKKSIVYHSASRENAEAGLRNKILQFEKEVARTRRKVFTAEGLHEDFGFCYQGMREFAESAGLDINETYSLVELREAAKKCSREVISKYSTELRKIKAI